MTAVPDWAITGPSTTDAQLALASAAGDRTAFAEIYDRYANRLHNFCVGMLCDRDGAADCVQETFFIAATRLPQLRQPDRLRPWLYAIARNEALRHIRERMRETASDDLPDAASHEAGPDTLAGRTELADLITEAAGGLSDRDQAVLELVYHRGLDGLELAEALGVSQTNANTLVYRLRETVERALGALLISRRARNAPDGCAELAVLLDGWDGKFTILMRKRIARHIESCSNCDEERRRLVSPAALLGVAPVFIPAPAWLREQTLGKIQLVCATTPLAGPPVEPDGKLANDDRTRSSLLPIALFVAAVVASVGMTLVWLQQTSAPIVSTEVSESASEPVITAPTSSPGPTPSTATVNTPTVIAPPAQEAPPAQTTVLPSPPTVFEPPPVLEPPVVEPTSDEPASDEQVPLIPRALPLPSLPPLSLPPSRPLPQPSAPRTGFARPPVLSPLTPVAPQNNSRMP